MCALFRAGSAGGDRRCSVQSVRVSGHSVIREPLLVRVQHSPKLSIIVSFALGKIKSEQRPRNLFFGQPISYNSITAQLRGDLCRDAISGGRTAETYLN